MLKRLLDSFSLAGEREPAEQVITNINIGASFKGTNLWILVFAIFIASLGLNINSAAVIIGAMLVSPLMGPIMGIGMGIAISDSTLLKKSIFNHLFATVVGLSTSTIFFLISPINEARSEILARTSPTIYDVLIALFGGLAGIVATSSRNKGNVIPGVAIATALMPPLCAAGFGIATLNPKFIFGALYLFCINTVFIAFATLLTARYLKFPQKQHADIKLRNSSRRIIIVVVILTILPSIYFAYDMIQQNRFISNANEFIERETKIKDDYLLNKKIDPSSGTITLTFGGKLITEEKILELKAKLNNYNLSRATLVIQQGFSTINEENANDEMLALTQALYEKENTIELLTTKLDSISTQKNLSNQIYKELKAQYPNTGSLILEQSHDVSDSTVKEIFVMVINSTKSYSTDDKTKITNWIKARMNTENIRIIFESR